MSHFAGSAIKQGPNVGRLDKWSEWNPTAKQPVWLLLSGACDPPEHIGISSRKGRGLRNGNFLVGITHDLVNMENTILEVNADHELFNTVRDLHMTKDTYMKHITEFFEECNNKGTKPMLYYSGHGETATGNWCFSDGTISIQEIFDMVPKGWCYPMIFSDACYSGHWANFCLKKSITGFNCLAACPEYSTALDTGEGGELTLFVTGKMQRPETEPMYSGGNRLEFPVTSEYNTVDYTDFIQGHITNIDNLVISQSMHDGKFSAIFASSKLYSPRPAHKWGIRRSYDSFVEFVEEEWKWVNGKSKVIYSLSCDEKFGFGVYLMENYGTNQTILSCTANIEKNLDEGLQITACAARKSTFYIIMTKDTKEYHGKGQKWFVREKWKQLDDDIQEGYKDGKAITGICYSIGLKQYFVVMTETPGRKQSYEWFNVTTEENSDRENWVDEKYKQGLHPTIIFKDPTVNKLLIVMTEDENRSPGFVYKSNYELRAVQHGDLRCRDSSLNSLLKKTREIRRTLDNFENLPFRALDRQQPKH